MLTGSTRRRRHPLARDGYQLPGGDGPAVAGHPLVGVGRLDTDMNPKDTLERGLDAAFAFDSISQIPDAVDIDALMAGEADAMDYERVGELVGQTTGRLAVKRTVGQITPGKFAEQTVGYAVGGALGREGGRLVLRAIEGPQGETVDIEIEVEEEGVEPDDEGVDVDIDDPEEEEGADDANGEPGDR